MDNITCFIDELYFYNKQKNLYVSKYSAGNFLKLLKKELSVNIVFMFPVAKEKTLNTYSTFVNPNEYIVEPLPYWDSIISYYRYLLKPKNYSYLKTKIKEIVDKYDIFWIRIASPFGLWLGKEAEKNGKFVIYNVVGDIRLAYLSEKYKGIKKRLAKFMGSYFHWKSLKLGKNERK
ncbi:unnamed protein product [marine sediment metagenome]|uniref:Glycosyltransferase subfamily 4-like N-terminal domain-containing protein n=1 Tax=marine sediment metagenome TaxID=412755 RepID=X1NZ76_9ZZZZ